MLSLRHHLLTTLIALCLPSLLAAQEEFRWRSEIAPDAAPAVAYGGTNAEDFLAILYCSSDPDGSPFITADVVVETEGYAEGARALLEFYGPRWTASLPVTINGPGLYPTVSARITFSEEDTIYRSMFNNVDQALYRLNPSQRPETVDFSFGRSEVWAFMEACENWWPGGEQPSVLEP